MSREAVISPARAHELLIQGVVDYAIYMLDPDGHVASWNSGAERIKGYAASEIVGEHFSRFYTPEDRDAGVPVRALDIARVTGRFTAEGWRVRKDGTNFWAMVVIHAIYDQGTFIGFAKITRDLTERREAQLELERSREQLFQAQKMEAVGQLTGGLAHDFNNLLTGIVGSLDLLKTRVAQGRTEDLDRYITAAQSAAARGAALTHRLLAFSRRQTLDPQPTDANKLVAEMEELLARSLGSGISFALELAEGLWATLCDGNQLENAVLNLCINARDALPNGGRLTIATANRVLDDAIAREWDIQPGDYVCLAVTDTGTGMTPDVVARAFDPFFTTKPMGEGTGLGLSMIYGFARQSGGQVEIQSKPGFGTIIRLYLPRYDAVPEPAADAEERTESRPAGRQESVLIVDDDAHVRMLVGDALRELGYLALEAEDGPSGLARLRTQARVDLLVTDLALPGGMTGVQLLEAARQRRPGLKALFITGDGEEQVWSGGQPPTGTAVLAKPFSMDRLATIMRQVITPD